MRLLLLSFACLSCGAVIPPLCTSRCGVKLYGYPDDGGLPAKWNCESFQSAEDKTLRLVTQNVSGDARLQSMCSRLNGAVLYTHPDEHWITSYGTDVMGTTICEWRTMQVNNWPPREGSMMHEYAHAAQQCGAPMPIDNGEDRDHSNWTRTGLRHALQMWEEEALHEEP